MKIAVVAERFDRAGGGAERSAYQICQQLLGRGHDVQVITGSCPHGPDDSEDLGVGESPGGGLTGRGEVSGADVPGAGVKEWRRGRRPRSGIDAIRFSNWVMQQLSERPYDVGLSFTTLAAATVVQPRAGTVRENIRRNIARRNTVASRALKQLAVHLSARQRALLYLERRTIANPIVKRFVAISRYVSEQMVRHYGVDAKSITLIPNAAEMPEVSPSQRLAFRQRVRRDLSIPDGQTVFMFVALNPGLKGIEPLLYAVKQLKQRDLPFVLLLVGQTERRQQRLAGTLGIRDHLRHVGKTNDMAAFYCAADVTVLPTYYDASSKVVIESLMMGVPAISSAYNGASDWLVAEDGQRRGRLVAEPDDVAGLVAAMTDLADSRERARCASAAVRLRDDLGMARHVDHLERVLTELSTNRQ